MAILGSQNGCLARISLEAPRAGTSRHQGNHVLASGRGPGERSEAVPRRFKDLSGSRTIAKPAALGLFSPARRKHCLPGWAARRTGTSSCRVTATGAGRDSGPRLPARVRTASWEARAQLMLAMETRAVLEAPGQLLVPPHPSSGGSSQPTSPGKMWSRDAHASPFPSGESR